MHIISWNENLVKSAKKSRLSCPDYRIGRWQFTLKSQQEVTIGFYFQKFNITILFDKAVHYNLQNKF